MEELSEQQKIARIKLEGMKILGHALAVDFMPLLDKVKAMVEAGAPKEDIFKEIETMRWLIEQMERFGKAEEEKKW